jgi:hypothetical protein
VSARRRRVPGRAALALAAVLCAALPAGAGTEVITETRKPDGSTRAGKALFDGQRMRVETTGGRRSIVYRGDRGLVWVIDHKRKNFIEVERPTPEALAGQARARMDDLSPDQRALAEAGVAGGVEIKETGRRGTVQGIPCTELHVMAAGARIADVCRASYADAKVERASFAAVRDLERLLGGSLTALLPPEAREDGAAAIESFARLDGVPMRVRTYEDGRFQSETTVKSVKKTAFPKGSFELPGGYAPQFSINIRKPAQ